jgi:hypothetical protein
MSHADHHRNGSETLNGSKRPEASGRQGIKLWLNIPRGQLESTTKRGKLYDTVRAFITLRCVGHDYFNKNRRGVYNPLLPRFAGKHVHISLARSPPDLVSC